MFIMVKLVFYQGFFKSKLFFLLLGWGKFTAVELMYHNYTIVFVGLPIPIVVVSAAISHEQYGLNDR